MTARRLLLALAILFGVWVPQLAHPADCDEADVRRDNQGFSVKRIVLADGKTTNTTSTKCVPPSRGPTGNQTATPWDHYEIVGEEGNTCTSWTAIVRSYPINDTAVCRGTCDAHDLATLAKGAVTNKFFVDPLGEGFDVVTSNVTCTGGVSIFLDIYWRNESR